MEFNHKLRGDDQLLGWWDKYTDQEPGYILSHFYAPFSAFLCICSIPVHPNPSTSKLLLLCLNIP